MKYFTQVFKDALAADPNALVNKQLRLVLFRNAPHGNVFYDYGVVPTVKKLIDGNYPGWELSDNGGVEVTSRLTTPASNVVVGTSVYIQFNSFPLNGLTRKVEVMAIGVEVVGSLWGETDPLLFVTDELFPEGRVVLDSDDSIVALEDTRVVGGTPVENWLIAWNNDANGAYRASSLTVGALATYFGAPDFRAAHHFDVWLYPQRVNYICNPSFEAIQNVHWATNGTFTRVHSEMNGFAGKFQGGNLVVESNTFPIDRNSGLWTVQLLVRGTGTPGGRLTVGLVSWGEEYSITDVDWGTELWDLSEDSFTTVKVIRKCPESVEGMLRIQLEEGSGIILDKVLAEPGPLLDRPYFDGDEQYGALDDFSWYGARGASYSLWYNNRRSITSRLFTHSTAGIITEDDPQGLVYNWVPAGTVVTQHLDVLRPNDLKTPPLPKTGVIPDSFLDPVFGVPGGTANILTADGSTVLTTLGENVTAANS